MPGFLFIGLLLDAVEIIVSPEATLFALFCSSARPLLGDGMRDLLFCWLMIELGSWWPFLSRVWYARYGLVPLDGPLAPEP